MISLRKLDNKDIPFIIEWMKDKEVTNHLQADFEKLANEETQKDFIKNSYTEKNKNFAIVDEFDEYLGSISLKNIDLEKKEAEYAICLRKSSQGKNVAFQATNQILMFAFQTLNLENIYLYVLSENLRANGFYNKFGFNYNTKEKSSLNIKGKMCDINWYNITKSGFFSLFKSREEIMTNVKKIKYNEITDNRGDLIAIEHPRQLEFPINRIYYIYNVSEGITRGKHSHNDLEQLLIAVSGSVTICTKTPFEEKQYILNDPSEALYIGPMVWREMKYFSKDAVLLVLASKKYDSDDYIRSYDEYYSKAKNHFKK